MLCLRGRVKEIDVSAFADQLLLQFLDNNFVQDLLTNKLGLAALFNTTVVMGTIDLRQLDLAAVQRREFVVPAFETIPPVAWMNESCLQLNASGLIAANPDAAALHGLMCF